MYSSMRLCAVCTEERLIGGHVERSAMMIKMSDLAGRNNEDCD
jgi:hypothetical protein